MQTWLSNLYVYGNRGRQRTQRSGKVWVERWKVLGVLSSVSRRRNGRHRPDRRARCWRDATTHNAAGAASNIVTIGPIQFLAWQYWQLRERACSCFASLWLWPLFVEAADISCGGRLQLNRQMWPRIPRGFGDRTRWPWRGRRRRTFPALGNRWSLTEVKKVWSCLI